MRKCSAVLSLLTALLLPLTVISSARAQDTAPPAASAPTGSGYRPLPLGVGIGVGYVINAGVDLMKPTVGSVRLVLTDRIILEPFVDLSYQSTSNEVGTASTDTSSTSVGAGAQVRYTMGSRGALDFAGIGQGLLSHASTTPSTDVHNSAQIFNLRWGFGLSWWFYSTWALSLDATNPLLSYTRNNTDNPGAVPDSTQSTFQFGLTFSPQVMLMTHMFF
jgi:hypothetical protein